MTLTTLKGQRRAGISFGTRGRKLGDFFLELIPGADLEILTSAGVIMSALSRAEFK